MAGSGKLRDANGGFFMLRRVVKQLSIVQSPAGQPHRDFVLNELHSESPDTCSNLTASNVRLPPYLISGLSVPS